MENLDTDLNLRMPHCSVVLASTEDVSDLCPVVLGIFKGGECLPKNQPLDHCLITLGLGPAIA